MHVKRLVTRPSCSAHDAYNPSLALLLAFCATSGRSNAFRCGRRFGRVPTKQVTCFSTSPCVRQESEQATREERFQKAGQDEQKLGVGGTYAHYLTLMESFGKPDKTKDKRQPVKTQGKAEGVEVPQKASRKAARETQEAPPKQPLRLRSTVQQMQEAPPKQPSHPRSTLQQTQKSPSKQPPRPRSTVQQTQEASPKQPLRPRSTVQQTQDASPKQHLRPSSAKSNTSSPKYGLLLQTANRTSWQKPMHIIAEQAGKFSKEKISLTDTKTIEERREALDYRGRYIQPTKSESSIGLPIPWLLDATSVSNMDGVELLSREIDRFADYAIPTTAERVARAAVIEETRTFIAENTFMDVESRVFGSEVTGLATMTSDVDLRLEWKHGAAPPGVMSIIKPMLQLAGRMELSTEYICVVFRNAKYPIISAQHKRTGIDVQIVSAPSTERQQPTTKEFIENFAHLRALYLLTRTMLGMRGLGDVFNGGIGSYGLLIMLVATLKRRGSEHPTTAGDQLLHFLKFYSDLDTEKYGVSVSPGKRFKKHDSWEWPIKEFIESSRNREDFVRAGQWAIGQRRPYQPYLLCLQDPADPTNDLGRKSNAIKHLLTTIRTLHHNLEPTVRKASDAVAEGKWNGDSLLLPLVGRCHEVYLERRRRVEEYGLELMMKGKRG